MDICTHLYSHEHLFIFPLKPIPFTCCEGLCYCHAHPTFIPSSCKLSSCFAIWPAAPASLEKKTVSVWSCLAMWPTEVNVFMPHLGRNVNDNFKIRLHLLFPVLCVETQFSSVCFSHSFVSNSLRPHEPQHARPPWFSFETNMSQIVYSFNLTKW